MQRSRISSIMRRRAPAEGLFCNYAQRVCMQNRLEGHDYCVRHILEDKTSPYRQCNYVSTRTGKRCVNAAPKADKKEGYCPEHGKLMAVYRYKMSQKQRPNVSAESVFNDLRHHTPAKAHTDDNNKEVRPTAQGAASSALEYGSSEESETEPLTMKQTWQYDEESDAESVDSEQEDLLKHAGVYTSEEVALIMRDKLIRLQSLYIDQFKHLQHLMKDRRRDYLLSAKNDKEHGALSTYKKDPKTRKNYFKLLALRKYHRRHGKEALLHRQSKDRRIAMSDSFNYRPPLFANCIDMMNGIKCTNRVMPLSKYCLNHITSDHNQILYQSCSFAECMRPVLDITGDATCAYHASLLPPSLLPEVESSNTPLVQEPTENKPDLVTDQTPNTEIPDALVDSINLENMTWNISDSSLSSTISRLTTSLTTGTAPIAKSNAHTPLRTSTDSTVDVSELHSPT